MRRALSTAWSIPISLWQMRGDPVWHVAREAHSTDPHDLSHRGGIVRGRGSPTQSGARHAQVPQHAGQRPRGNGPFVFVEPISLARVSASATSRPTLGSLRRFT